MSSISVICPAWQAAATLAQALASVHAQIVRPAEIVVVDDGSTDETAKIAEASGATAVIRKPHAGAPAALNAGIAAARGELLAFIDADDLWPADKLAAQADMLALDANLAGVLGLMQYFLSPDMDPVARVRHRVPDDLQTAWMTSALLVRRQALETIGGFDESIHAGYAIDWFDRGRRLGFVFAIPKRVVLLRRVSTGSLSHRSARRDAGYALMAWRAVQRRRSTQGTK